MASKMLGRAACPECGFPHAHVKISDKETSKAYRYCPECGSQYYARSQAQHDALVAKLVYPPVPTGEPAKMVPVEYPAPTPQPPDEKPVAAPEPQSYKVVFGVKVPV